MLKRANFDFINEPMLSIDGFLLQLRKGGDFWRMHLDYCKSGMNNELGVYSHQQDIPEIIKNENEIIMVYRGLVAEDGSKHNITLRLKIIQKEGALYFSAEMENNSSVRVNELQYPFFEFDRINEELENDELLLPDVLGRKIKNPHKNAVLAHTEYMAADYKNVLKLFSYPGPVAMPWMGIQSGDKYLYLGWHSEKWRQFSLVIGSEPRASEEEYFIYSISSYPAVQPGEAVIYDGFVLAAFKGDWRRGIDFYHSWADKCWNALPEIKKPAMKNLFGWQRIILKHQYGEIFHTYEELPGIYKEGAKYGINMILLFAWWQEGMDNGYPNYQPDPALGGAEKLKKAIEEINSLGGIVILYANGHLIDVSQDYYKNEGFRYTMKDIEKNEYREFYKFSNNGTLLRYGHKTFATGCHGASRWREKLLEIENRHLELGSNGTFFDQLGICFNFCFDESHEHGKRIDEDPHMRLKTVKKMREILSDNEYFGTEWAIDRLMPHMDFIHGCGFGERISEDEYPYILRYAFPNAIMSNRYIHDERQGFKGYLNYAFVFGMIFDVSIYRGRAKSIEVTHEYAEHIGKLTEMRKKYLEFFTEGRFDLPDFSLPEGVWAAQYMLGDRKIITIWNASDELAELCGKTIMPDDVDVIELA